MKLAESFSKLMILAASILSLNSFAESELSGKYFEKTSKHLWIEIDKDSYFSTNMTFHWESVPVLKERFPHRIKYDEDKKVYWVKGLLSTTWVLNGEKWDCDYPVVFLLDPNSSKEFIDVTTKRPKDIYVPYKKGNCDYSQSGNDEEYFSFRRQP